MLHSIHSINQGMEAVRQVHHFIKIYYSRIDTENLTGTHTVTHTVRELFKVNNDVLHPVSVILRD